MEDSSPPDRNSSISTVTFDTRSEALILPGGVVSVAGVTVLTGGVELTWSSCMLAFGMWGTIVGISVVLLGIWDQFQQSSMSRLLGLGLVVLALASGVIVGVAGYQCRNRRRGMARGGEAEGKIILAGETSSGCTKTMTV